MRACASRLVGLAAESAICSTSNSLNASPSCGLRAFKHSKFSSQPQTYSSFANSVPGAAGFAPGASNQLPPSLSHNKETYSLFRAYFLLSKARLSLLVASTATAGYALGSGSSVDWAQMGWTTLGTFLAAGMFSPPLHYLRVHCTH